MEVQLLTLESQCLEVVDGFDVVITEWAKGVFLHLAAKLIISAQYRSLSLCLNSKISKRMQQNHHFLGVNNYLRLVLFDMSAISI
jgi:hypothetical protein